MAERQLVKVRAYMDDGSVRELEGDEARRWDMQITNDSIFVFLHNAIEVPLYEWKEYKRPPETDATFISFARMQSVYVTLSDDMKRGVDDMIAIINSASADEDAKGAAIDTLQAILVKP